MNRIRIIRRLSCLVAGLTCAAMSSAVALAGPLPLPGGASGHNPPPSGPVPAPGGMLGWQIALIATGAAVLAVVLTVLVERARTTRRQLAPSGA